jgi:hypothetical protein
MSTETDELQLAEGFPVIDLSGFVEAVKRALAPTLDIPHKCRRCDDDALCNECRAVAVRRDWCSCGHQRALHHNNMGCLGTMAGELCDCTLFELRIEGTP